MAKQPTPLSRFAKRRFTWSQILVLLLIILFMLVSLPTVILLVFGLLPTMVAFLIDRSYQHSATFSVGSLNIAGIFPYLLELWMGYNTMDYVLQKMSDVFAIAIMYSGAAFGWALFSSLPPIVGSFYAVVNKQQIASLKAKQKKLLEEWGNEVSDDEPAMPDIEQTTDQKTALERFDAGESSGIGGGAVEELDLS